MFCFHVTRIQVLNNKINTLNKTKYAIRNIFLIFDGNNLLKGGKEQAFLRDDHDYLGSDG